jgi:hypothetical protein
MFTIKNRQSLEEAKQFIEKKTNNKKSINWLGN